MYLDYLKTRYKPENFPIPMEEVAERFEEITTADGTQIFKNHMGFITYQFKGDAVIVSDIYAVPEFRKTQIGEVYLFTNLLKEAQALGKRVMIGFSEYGGQNQEIGIKAMQKRGFVPAFKTKNKIVFVKGI